MLTTTPQAHNTPVIRMYGIPGHGKGEVDHVGGIAKVTIREMAARGQSFCNAADIVQALNERYGDSSQMKYVIKEIPAPQLTSARTIVAPVEGSSKFRSMVFTPGANIFKASSRLCIYEQCKEYYGSCDSFTDYSLQVMKYNQPYLRSKITADGDEDEEEINDDEEDGNGLWEFLTVDSVVAVANKSTQDPVWFIKIKSNNCVEEEIVYDSYQNAIIPGVRFLKGHFLERSDIYKDYMVFKESKLETFFCRETILYPFVPLQECKKGLKLNNNDYADILKYAEKNGYF